MKTQQRQPSVEGAMSGGDRIRGLVAFEIAYQKLLHERPGILASETGGELAWMMRARQRDAARWKASGLPGRRDENWKFTNLKEIEEAEVDLATVPLEPPDRRFFPRLQGPVAAELVFCNGIFTRQISTLPRIKGVSVLVLSELFEECVNDGWTPERKARLAKFRAHLEESDADLANVFAAMNTSFMQDGVVVHVDQGIAVDLPIVITHLAESDAAAGTRRLPVMFPRVFTSLDPLAELSLIEMYAGRNGQRYLASAVSDVRLERGARLTHCVLQMEGSEGLHVGTTRVHQKRDSFSESFQFSLGGKLARHDFHVSLEGEGAEAVVGGLCLLQGNLHGNQIVDSHTTIEHVAPDTVSQQLYKGILDGESRSVFKGRIRIHRGAQRSSAAQMNNNILLNQKAEAITRPELEIHADDVKASHGATVGQLDPEHVFYLRARAIPASQAVKILARGFAQDVVFQIRNGPTRALLGELVDEHFQSLDFATESNRS